MSDYITAEQFRKQPEKVQKTLLDWWEPKAYDVYYHLQSKSDGTIASSYIYDLQFFKENKGKSYIPLFTETQLRHFIEEKTEGKFSTSYKERGINGIYVFEFSSTKVFEFGFFHVITKDILQAYWEVACKIANEEVIR